ncbi:MAG: twin-arginine translocation signal domain-containing protein [Pedosphaera sp.]|nr:twin-arginine translocation signal domain-containing protein [Pedosphaera sp.]
MKTKTSSIAKAAVTRRDFLKATAAVAAPMIVPASVLGLDGKTAPSNRVTMAFIGVGNQGSGDMQQFLKDDRVQVVAVCDPNRESAGYWNGSVRGRDPARKGVDEFYAKQRASGQYRGCAAHEDFREVYGNKSIDAVEIATPDHWHAYMVVAAAAAGKDIYCQKPLSLTVRDGRLMSDAVKNTKRVFQTGSQQRSDKNFRLACELVRNGRLGKLKTVKVGQPPGRPDFGKTGDRKKPERVPEGFNYDLWLGPAPDAPYAPARCHVNFRWIYDYSGGQVTDWGGHHPDIAQWGMGMEQTGPVEIRNAKGVFPPDELWDTATEYHFEAVYKDGAVMVVSDKFPNGVRFEGSDGWVFVSRGKIEAEPKSLLTEAFGEKDTRLYVSENHFRNFIDCVQSRKECVAPCEQAHRSITVAHLGNIAMLLRQDIKWDPVKEQIIGNPAAQWMLDRPSRAPWKLV